jgi:hypothetical protein
LKTVYVLVQLQPDKGKVLGAIIFIGDIDSAGKGMVHLVQAGIDLIIDMVLPVFGTGRAAGRTEIVSKGGVEEGGEGLMLIKG